MDFFHPSLRMLFLLAGSRNMLQLCQKNTPETLFSRKSAIFMADFSFSTSSGWNFDLQGGICFFIRPELYRNPVPAYCLTKRRARISFLSGHAAFYRILCRQLRESPIFLPEVRSCG
jgi:hypothetical protein